VYSLSSRMKRGRWFMRLMPFHPKSSTHVVERLRLSYRSFVGKLRRRPKIKPEPPASTASNPEQEVRGTRFLVTSWNCNTLHTALDIPYDNNGFPSDRNCSEDPGNRHCGGENDVCKTAVGVSPS
jgi:hypothetical protein